MKGTHLNESHREKLSAKIGITQLGGKEQSQFIINNSRLIIYGEDNSSRSFFVGEYWKCFMQKSFLLLLVTPTATFRT